MFRQTACDCLHCIHIIYIYITYTRACIYTIVGYCGWGISCAEAVHVFTLFSTDTIVWIVDFVHFVIKTQLYKKLSMY